MKLRAPIASLAVAGTAAALSGTAAFLLPAAAGASAVTHTLKFTSVQQATVRFSKTIGAAEDKDVKNGTVIGYDVLRFVVNPKTNTASIGVTLDTKNGFLYGVLRESGGAVTRGKVTGGTGKYAGATGTITAKSNKSGNRTAVTIIYHT
jgi:hypothetical protein